MRHLTARTAHGAAALVLALLAGACATTDGPVATPTESVVPPVTETAGGSEPASPPTDAPETDTPETDTPSTPPTTSAGGGSSGGGTETSAAPFPADTRPDTSEGSGPRVTLTDIRGGRHDGFDRIVLEVGGGGMAGWRVAYVDAATGQASGEPVEVDGTAILEVMLDHTGYPDDTGVDFYAGPRRVAGPGQAVTEVVLDSAFEGMTQLFIGTTGELPFRVYALDGRVVIEVASAR